MEALITHNHAASPKYNDGSKEVAGSHLPQNDGGRRLEQNIWDEENEDD